MKKTEHPNKQLMDLIIAMEPPSTVRQAFLRAGLATFVGKIWSWNRGALADYSREELQALIRFMDRSHHVV